MRKAGLVVTFAVLTALSAFLLAEGRALLGTIGLLLFGGGGAVYLVLDRKPRPAARSVVHGTLPGAERHTTSWRGVVFPRRNVAPLMTVLGSAIFTVVGAVFLFGGLAGVTAPGAGMGRGLVFLVLGLVTVATFGFFAVMGARSLFRPGGIALLPEGIYLRAPAGTAWVRWADLDMADVLRQGNNASVVLAVWPREAIALEGAHRWLRGINHRWYHFDVGYPGNYLRLPPEMVVTAIRHHWLRPSARARLADPAAATVEALPTDAPETPP